MQDTVNAFINIFAIPGSESGPLAGLTFGAKDLYDVADFVTGFGSPDWARTHPSAVRHAAAVAALLDAGADLVGKTHTDEIAYSLMGVNAHYGTPINSRAPDRVPGGSSSGSVAATAAGLVDIGLGSDTGGSVRMPASFCGVYGIRPTHGRVDLSGARPLAPSFDTVGWFARDGATLALAGKAFQIDAPQELPKVRLIVAEDAMSIARPETLAAIAPAIKGLETLLGAARTMPISDDGLAQWRDVFVVCQAAEIWQSHGDWVTQTTPNFGPGIKERFDRASRITADEAAQARGKREYIRIRLNELLGNDGLLVLPTAPGPAPLLDADNAALDEYRGLALQLLCAAGHAGLPQVNIPAGLVDGAPVGLSIIAGRGRDEDLLSIARALPVRL